MEQVIPLKKYIINAMRKLKKLAVAESAICHRLLVERNFAFCQN